MPRTPKTLAHIRSMVQRGEGLVVDRGNPQEAILYSVTIIRNHLDALSRALSRPDAAMSEKDRKIISSELHAIQQKWRDLSERMAKG